VTTLLPEQELQVRLTSDGSHCLVRFEGAVVASAVHPLQELVDQLGSLRCDVVSVDLTEVTQWDTVGEKAISDLWNYLGGRGIRGEFCEPPSGRILTAD
jgi:hypothetical protein